MGGPGSGRKKGGNGFDRGVASEYKKVRTTPKAGGRQGKRNAAKYAIAKRKSGGYDMGKVSGKD